jgi:hypothetical protein
VLSHDVQKTQSTKLPTKAQAFSFHPRAPGDIQAFMDGWAHKGAAPSNKHNMASAMTRGGGKERETR